MKVLPKTVQIVQAEYIQQGFSAAQAASIGWAAFFEEKAAECEGRYQGRFDYPGKYDCYCATCNEGNSFGAPDSMRLFIIAHKGHKTNTRRVK